MKRVVTITVLFSLLLLEHSISVAGALESGKVVGRHIHGLARDYQGSPVMINGDPLIYQSGALEELIRVEDSQFLLSVFNHAIGSVYLSPYDAEQKNYIDTMALDLEPVAGLANPMSGLKTDWNTLLVSESNAVDGNKFDLFQNEVKPYFKDKADMVNPYHYGWVSEVVVLGAAGETKVIKNYAVGRVAASHLLLMPDGKTLYLLDSKHSGNLYIFVAQEAKSFASGSLYSVNEVDGALQIKLLATGSALKAKFRLRKASFDGLLDSAHLEAGRCPQGFEKTVSFFGTECLKVRTRAQSYIGLFEPIRMVAFNQFPGLDFKANDMIYHADSNRIAFNTEGKREVSYPLGENSEMQSSFIMEARP